MILTNKQILITGANRGIGLAFAKMAAKEHSHLHLVLRNENSSLTNELQQLGAKSVQQWQADLSSKAEVFALIEKIKNLEIDILFNNAGLLTGGLIEEQSIDEIYNMLQVNIASLIHLTHAILPGMINRKHGKIINNSSVSAIMHFPCASTYAASKAAVAAFTDCIKLELKKTGVSTLLLITPGIKTRMFDQIEPLYSKNFDIPSDSITADDYAELIKKAIIEDKEILEPAQYSPTGIGLGIAKYLKPVFEAGALKRFTR